MNQSLLYTIVGVLLIAPQTIQFGIGKEIIFNHAELAHGEAFTIQPSISKKICLPFDLKIKQDSKALHNFEGEDDASWMTLSMKRWIWINVHYADGREVFPKKPNIFTLTFSNDHTFSATTDCNSMIGNFEVANDAISFGPVAATKMFCENSQEMVFALILERAKKFHFTLNGELILELEGGSAVFR